MTVRGMTTAVTVAGALALSGCGSQPSQASVDSGHTAAVGFIGAYNPPVKTCVQLETDFRLWVTGGASADGGPAAALSSDGQHIAAEATRPYIAALASNGDIDRSCPSRFAHDQGL